MYSFEFRPDPVILAIGAHCDDIEIGCGATLAALAAARPDARIHCWVFSGDAARAEESRQCLQRMIGPACAGIAFHEFRDGFFPAEWGAIKERFRALAPSIDPDLVFTHHADDAHQDHRVLSDLTGNHFRRTSVLEYEIVKYDGDLSRPNVFYPLTAAQVEAKVEALIQSFPTQAGKPWFTRSTFEAIARLRGVECNAPGGYAEAFHARKVCLGPWGPGRA